MITRLVFTFALCVSLALALPNAALAQDGVNFQHFRKGADIEIASDRAYLLIRMPATSVSTKLQPVFLRKPSEQELGGYRAAKQQAYNEALKNDEDIGPLETFAFEYSEAINLYQLENGRFYSKEGNDRIFVIAVQPGEYVFYGLGFNKYLWQCNCMGTVSFGAKAGRVTNLGSILIDLAWSESEFPELAQDTGLGKKMRQDYPMFAAGVRPPVGNSVPGQLARLSVEAAEYEAAGSFLEPARLLANRLAPIPGVLAYDAGNVIDAKTGRTVPKRF
ncbi:hypothetical protein GRI43_07690 [Altererythrobacter luteolus]|uniref:Uncharacterized protein n=1 Tax=Pontixanthobacter luteolus TaxID=295089 RepID=A0A6I4V5Q4_9SPHN|nr:hypothetical protein [Pontixanthobacter luteolus]MXP47272.1 hypothetical protein [Pontixanthobacter luteolus]